jgi:hypothetical protein
MNIAGFRKCVVVLYAIPVLYFFFFPVAFAKNLNIFPAKKKSHLKMSSYLGKLEKEYKESTSAHKMFAQGMNISSYDPDKVTVYLMSTPDTSIDENALYDLGAQIIKQSGNVTKAKVPVSALSTVADTVKGVSFMKTPDKLIPVVVESEGVHLTGADNYHNAGYTGSGVKVAVIDVGFAGLSSAISGGELPNNIDKLKRIDCTGASCVSSNFSAETEPHGTAVAETVYDMAPGATLYLIKIADGLDLEDAKNFAINNGIKIINMSLVVPNTNFYDGTCWYPDFVNPVCTADDAYANNILWVNAAGNEAQRHYEAVFTDSDSDGWHNVSGSSETINISANTGDIIQVYLTWDAWPTTDQDYDLYLYNGSGTLVDGSADFQTGSQPPIEIIIYSVPANGTYYLSIRQESATSNHSMEVYSLYRDLSPAVASSSLLGPADASGVIAVGAINYKNWTTGPQALYSSRGPTNDGRIKPDIMGPDNVSSDVYGSGFGGTSASCAHVTGAAALILDKNPGFSVDQLWDSLISTAIDMGTPGKDNIYGYGRLVNLDNCPNDPNKIEPGICGCGVSDIDTDSDGTLNCNENCPNDPNKTQPGICGCGIADTDSDGDGIPDCNDDCDNLIDSDGDGTSDCDDLCPNDPNKTQPGTCGCSIADKDSDGDGTLDCEDANDDNDGLPDGEEQGPDGNDPDYDGNDDGIADSLQDNVASFHTYGNQGYVTLESQPGTSISNCTAKDNPSKTNAPSNVEFSYGFFEFAITGVGNGATTIVALHFPVGTTFGTYYKYGRTSLNPINHWYEFLYDGQTGAEINGNVITLHFVDGMRGDDDLTANGIIVDVGAPGVVAASGGEGGSTIVASDGGGGGGCFIATAAYGSLMEPHVKILRDFRDRFLLGNTVGDSFVRLYYTHSPPIADFIAEHDSLRAMVRISLFPVVGVSWIALKFGPLSTVALILFFTSCFVGLVWFSRRYKE